MFNPIPLRGPRRVVRNTDDDPKLIRQSLQLHLPRPIARTISTATISLDQPSLGVWVSDATLLQPPPSNRSDGKSCRLVGCPNPDIPRVPPLIVDAVGNTHAACIPAKIMIEYLSTLATITAAG